MRFNVRRIIPSFFVLALVLSVGLGLVRPAPANAQVAQASGSYRFIDIGEGLIELYESGELTQEEEDYLADTVDNFGGSVTGIGYNCENPTGTTCQAYFIPTGDGDFDRIDHFFDLAVDENTNCRDGIVLVSGSRNPRQGNYDNSCLSPDGPEEIHVSGSPSNPGAYYNGDGQFTDQAAANTERPQEPNDPPPTGEDDPPEETPATCESEGLSLSWILCPVLFGADAVMRKLDQSIIALLSIPNDYYNNADLEQAWRRMRNIAYLILVPIALVMVISTALGFDFVSAYTVKRALPRLIIAAIFIALSFEITRLLVVMTNDIGKGIGGIVISAFTGAETISIASVFSPNNSDSIVSAPIFVGALGLGLAAIGSLGIILSYILVAIVALAIGFFLLSFRQMLIIALMLVAPLAILAWIFPGNDKLWKLWWGTFSKLLMLFPLIMLLIAVGKSFASLVADTDGSFVSTLIKLVAYTAPYFMIPATFRFAGGIFAAIAGMANDRSRGFFDRNRNYRQQHIGENVKRNISNPILNKRADWDRRLRESSSSGSWVSKRAKRLGSRMISGHDVTAARAAQQAEREKEINDIVNAGPDDEVRGLAALDAYNMGFSKAEAAGLAQEVDGKRQYKTLGGKWVDEGYVARAKSRWGKDRFAQQAAVSYEMRKANTLEEAEGISDRYMQLAQNGWGMSKGEAMGAWIGPAFQNQNSNLAYKYTRFRDDGSAYIDGKGLAAESVYKRGSYNMSQQHVKTIKDLGVAYDTAQEDLRQAAAGRIMDNKTGRYVTGTAAQVGAAVTTANQTIYDAQQTMQSFVQVYEGGGGGTTMVAEHDGEPEFAPSGGGGRGTTIRTQTQGAAMTAEEVRRQAQKMNILRPPDPSTETYSPGPPPKNPRLT